MADPNSQPSTSPPNPDGLTREEILRLCLLPDALTDNLTPREAVELVRLSTAQRSAGLKAKVAAYNATVPPHR